MYIIGINSFICIGIILIAGTVLVIKIYGMSNKYGEYGMMKKLAKRSVPKVVKSNNRKVLFHRKSREKLAIKFLSKVNSEDGKAVK